VAISSAVLEQFRGVLVRTAGGYLRNPIRTHRVTCAVCTTPCPGYERCIPCRKQLHEPGERADQVAALTYVFANKQSGYVMRGYKAQPRPVQEHRDVVALTAILGLGLHSGCAGRLMGNAITHWAAIPSMPAKAGEHPLRQLVTQAAPGLECKLQGAPTASNSRAVSSEHFWMPAVPQGAHVLLIDDTWTSGGHAQSAVLAARGAGAAHVSVLVVARWIEPGWAVLDGERKIDPETYLRGLSTDDYDPLICPWTGGGCP
jgi:hypothetical protein